MNRCASRNGLDRDDKGIDGNKKIRGRKRQLIVDIMGNLPGIIVHAVNVSDVVGGQDLLHTFLEYLPKLIKVLVDQGYEGELMKSTGEEYGVAVEVVHNEPGQKGFVMQAKRWVVERTIAWLNRYRRLAKDYKRFTENSEAMIYFASIHLMLRRLRPDSSKKEKEWRKRKYALNNPGTKTLKVSETFRVWGFHLQLLSRYKKNNNAQALAS